MTDRAPKSIAEFEQQYAERSGITMTELHDLGLHGALCDCREEGCDGFQMLSDSWRRTSRELEG